MSAADFDKLSGWGEIAGHLRRSVRTVQRWERELGLPVQRSPTRRGQAIFASRAELDAWLRRTELPSDERAEQDPGDGGEADNDNGLNDSIEGHGATGVAAAGRGWRRALVAGLVLVLLTVGAAWWTPWKTGSRRGATIASQVLVRGSVIEGRWGGGPESDGVLVWSVPLGRDARRVHWDAIRYDATWSDSVATVDLDGSGTPSFVVPLRYSTSATQMPVSDAVVAVSDRGDLEWAVMPDFELACGGQVYEGPWRLTSVIVSSAPGPKVIWASYTHHTWWPSVVIEILPDGSYRTRYVQAGWVMTLAEFDTPEGRWLVAGGVLNEHRRGSLAMLDLSSDATYVAPGNGEEFRCEADGQAPARLTTMPITEVSAVQSQPYDLVTEFRPMPGRLRFDLGYGRLIASLGLDGRVSEAAYTDKYWKDHSLLFDGAVINHSSVNCPEARSPVEIREWTPTTGWTSYQVMPTGAAPPR